MAIKLTIPDSIRPHLTSTPERGVFGVKDWTAWFNRRFAKTGSLRMVPDKETRLSGRIMGIRKTKSGNTLVVEGPNPMPDEEFWTQPRPVISRLSFIEAGFEVVTTFKAVILGRAEIKGQPVVELGDIKDVHVQIAPYVMSLAGSSEVEVGLVLRGQWYDMKPQRLSLNRFWLSGDLPSDIGPEGITADKASIKLGSSDQDMPISLKLIPQRGGDWEAQVDKVSDIVFNKLALFLEKRWATAAEKKRTQKPAEGRKAAWVGSGAVGGSGGGGGGAGGGGDNGEAAPAAESTVEDIFKPHYLLLTDDETWHTRMARYGVINVQANTNLQDAIDSMTSQRTDLVLADADLWQEDALLMAQTVRSQSRLAKYPVFWFGGPESLFAESGGQDLVDLGAWDYLERTVEEDELLRRIRWATKNEPMGEGGSMMIVSPDARMEYRLGIALHKEGIRMHKSPKVEELTTALNDVQPRWIVVDGMNYAGAQDRVVKGCLDWAKRHSEPDEETAVFLISGSVQPEEANRWMSMGVADILIYDPTMTDIVERIHMSI